jgi:hypothetical protein
MTRPLSTLQRIFTSGWKVGLVRFLVTFSLVAAATAVPLASAPRAAAAEKPRFKMPFNCDEVWYGGSYYGHSPDYNSIDWNQPGGKDKGRPVRAGVVGKVVRIDYQANGYGNYVDVDAGGGWVTRYAHLDSVNVGKVGVGELTQIGTVGSTGLPPNSDHLHYEQRLNDVVQPAEFSGVAFHYTNIDLASGYEGEANTSKNCSGSPAPGGWYIAPSPANGERIAGPLHLGVDAVANGNDGLKRVDITVYDPVEQRWKPAISQAFGPGINEKQVFADYPTVSGTAYLFSFDVYSNNGQFQLSPSGVRRACVDVPCSPYAGGSGGGGSIGGGCVPNPQVDLAVSALSGDDGWVRSNATVTLSGFDSNGCGQSVSLEYSLDGGAWTTYSSPVAVNGDGIHHLRHRARSGGVSGAEQDLEVKIDTVPPVIGSPTIRAPMDVNGIIRDTATISTPWTDATSGVRWVRHKCGSDPFAQSAGGDASWTLQGEGVTNCDSYARDIAGWEAQTWNSGPLIFNMLTLDAEGTLEFDGDTGTSVSGQTRAGTFRATNNTGTNVSQPVWLTSSNPVTVTGNTNSSFGTTPAPTPVPRLSYPFSYYLNRSVHIQGPLVIDTVNTPLPPVCLYVDGDILIRAVKLNSKVCLIATGKITDRSTSSTFVSGDPANGMLMMAGGDVGIGSTGDTNTGLIFAPNSKVSFSGSTGLVVKGSVVAKDISLSGVTNTQFSYAPGFAPSTLPLPLAPSYIAPPPPPSTPAVPSPTFPSAGTTMRDNAYCVIWSGSTYGYRFEVNSSATFSASTRVAGADTLEPQYCTNSGPAETKLYWRVKALGVGDIESAWSNVQSFATGPLPSQLAVNDISVAEGNSGTRVATFTVTRSGDRTRAASVVYQTASGSATAGSDYVGVPATTLNFAPGDASKSVAVTIVGDTNVEADETFFLNLSSPVGVTMVNPASGTATITNDDFPPKFAVNDITVVKGNSGSKIANFAVTRSGVATGTASVVYQTMDGSATAGSDYQALPPTTLNFAPGETNKNVSVTILGDTTVEFDEWFLLNLSMPVGAAIDDGSGMATITNDDAAQAAPSLAINDVTVTEGSMGTKTVSFTVTRSGSTVGTTAVTYQTMNGSAVAGSDFTGVGPATLSFAPGDTAKTVPITIIGDTQVEQNEFFYVMLTSYTGVTISKSMGTATIVNDD